MSCIGLLFSSVCILLTFINTWSELERGVGNCCRTASWSWIWSQSSQNHDPKDDFDTWGDGCFSFRCRISDSLWLSFWVLTCVTVFGICFQEEVVLKRCWLARYWGLASSYGNMAWIECVLWCGEWDEKLVFYITCFSSLCPGNKKWYIWHFVWL